MPSFDVVSEMDLHEVRNAVDQAARELSTRFDFRGIEARIELEEESILLTAPEEFQIGQLKDILRSKMASRNKDNARLVTKVLKESKLKIQSQINGDKVRVTGKKRDDLQEAMAALKASDLNIPLQYNNFRD